MEMNTYLMGVVKKMKDVIGDIIFKNDGCNRERIYQRWWLKVVANGVSFH